MRLVASRGLMASVAALALVLALVLAGRASGTSSPKATQWIVSKYGFSIVLPSDWYPIQRTTSAVKQQVALLEKEKQTSLASAYKSILASAESVRELSVYRFQAFLWPPLDSLVPTEVSVQVVAAKRAYTRAELPAIGETYRRSFAAGKGAKITGPAQVSLPSGPAELIEGTVPNGGGVTTGLALYILEHGKRLYVLSFEIGGSYLATAKPGFKAIAEDFSFKT